MGVGYEDEARSDMTEDQARSRPRESSESIDGATSWPQTVTLSKVEVSAVRQGGSLFAEAPEADSQTPMYVTECESLVVPDRESIIDRGSWSDTLKSMRRQRVTAPKKFSPSKGGLL